MNRLPLRLVCRLAVSLIVLWVMAGDGWAQTRPRPARPFRGIFGGGQQTPDPNRTRTELTLTAGIQGGYDDNVTGSEGGGSDAGLPQTATSGYTGLANATLDYFFGKASRSVRVSAAGDLSAYPEFIDGVVPGGSLLVDLVTNVGRRNTLVVNQQVGYEPLFAFGGLSASTSVPPRGADAPPATGGLFERRSVTYLTSASVERRWSRRNSSTVVYSYESQRYTDGDGGDSRGHTARADFRREFSPRTAVRLAYSFAESEFDDLGGTTWPLRQHTLEGGPTLGIRLSARRSLSLSASGGAMRVESVASSTEQLFRYWAPYGAGTATLTLSDTSSVSAAYRRALSVLEGLTSQAFYADNIGLTASSLLTSRIDARLSGGLSTGRTPAESGALSDFRIYTASADVRVAVSRFAAVTLGYGYYYHRYSDPADLPVGFPAEYDRHSVRLGMTFWVPLRGTFSGTARGTQ